MLYQFQTEFMRSGATTVSSASGGPSYRIMLVDDHAIVRAGFRRLLEQRSDFRVVAEAADAEHGKSMCYPG